MLIKRLLCAALACTCFIFCSAQKDSLFKQAKNTGEITRLEDCKLPQQMYDRIKQMKPAEVAVLKEELQQPIRDEEGEKLFTIKLRYYADYIIGIIKEAPVNQSNLQTVSDKRINIPVKWTCTPDSMGHEPHSVLMSEMKSYEALYHCKNWKQEIEKNAEEEFGKPDEQTIKKKKKKLFIF